MENISKNAENQKSNRKNDFFVGGGDFLPKTEGRGRGRAFCRTVHLLKQRISQASSVISLTLYFLLIHNFSLCFLSIYFSKTRYCCVFCEDILVWQSWLLVYSCVLWVIWEIAKNLHRSLFRCFQGQTYHNMSMTKFNIFMKIPIWTKNYTNPNLFQV